MSMKKPMTDQEFSLFFTPIVSNAHTYGIDSQHAQVDILGFVKSMKDASPETRQWMKDGIKAKLKAIANKQTDFHQDMRMVLDTILKAMV